MLHQARVVTLLALCAIATASFAAGQDGQGGIRQVDADRSGSISRTEAANHPGLAQHFDAIDTNRDGLLTEPELRAWRSAHPHQGHSRGAAHPGDKPGFGALDRNNDHAVSRQEVAARPKLAERFDQVDTNRDGNVTKEEIKAYRATHGKANKPPRP